MRHWLKAHRGLLVFLLCLGVVRTAVADWNPIPSGSMRPTLVEGDVVLVDRLAYDLKVPLTNVALARLGEPRRGDVITFESPRDGVRLIKRLVGVPGDTVELRRGRLVVNGRPATYSDALDVVEWIDSTPVRAIRATERLDAAGHAVQFIPMASSNRDFGPVVVPHDSYFFLGDNRDNSADSRYVGVVPRALLIGRAHRVLVSADILGDWRPRPGRFGKAIE